jgi:ABC-type nitrate/sulfonate/bicarbonate transport system substrate-binding protein
VEIKPGGIDIPPVKLVASGSGEFGQESGGETLIIARVMNIPIRAIAAWQPGGAPAIITLSSTGIKTPKDLSKKRIAVGYGKPVEYVYLALLEKEGIDRKSIEESVFKFDITPLLDGRIDAFTGFKVNQPFVIESKGFKPVIIDPNDYGVRTYGITLFTTDEIIKSKPDMVKRFVQASAEGWEYAFNHPEEAIDICIRAQGKDILQYDREIEIKKLKAYAATSRTLGKPIGWMDKEIWTQIYNNLNKCKTPEGKPVLEKSIEINSVFSNQFVKDKGD